MPRKDIYHDIVKNALIKDGWTITHARIEPERVLYIAVSQATFAGIFSEPLGNLFLLDKDIKLIVFDKESEVILRWIR
ncbi:MAG: element excision factor XisH family protein [Candidatus Poribacteria bacterium]